MKGFFYSTMAVAIISTLVLMAVTSIKYAEYGMPPSKTDLGGRILSAYYFIEWEYNNNRIPPSSSGGRRGCAPLVVIDTLEDAIESLAKPYVIYVCGD